MRVVAYVRVSGAGQIDAWGLDRQEEVIRQAARHGGHRIVGWEYDRGITGTVGDDERPGLRAAFDRIGQDADAILVADVDRFARALHVQEAALAVVWKRGGQVITATRGTVDMDDPDDPGRRFLRQVMGAVVELEKGNIVLRLRQGRDRKAANGQHAVGEYPFGTTGGGKGRERDAVPDPEEQATVARIVELRNAGETYRAIVAQLDAEGLPPRRADRWSAMSVRRVYLRATQGALPKPR